MGYPGDQGNPDGRPPGDEAPFAARGAEHGGPSPAGTDPFGFGPAAGASTTGPQGTAQAGTGADERSAPPSFNGEPFSPEPFTPESFAPDPFGGPGGFGQDGPGQGTPGQGVPGQGVPGQGFSAQDGPGQGGFAQNDFEHGVPGHDDFGHSTPGQGTPGQFDFRQDDFGQSPPGQGGTDFSSADSFGTGPFQGGPPADPAGPTAAWGDGQPPGPSFGAAGEPPAPDGGTPEGRRRNLPLIIGGAVVAGLVVIGGGVGVASMMKDDPKPKAAPPKAAPSPKAPPTPRATPLEPVKLKSRATDPVKLTLPEVFRSSTFKVGKQKYIRTAWNDKKGCTGVVGGGSLASALRKGDCRQALRATYALGSGQLIGTVGVLNLKTEAAAQKAAKAAAAKESFLQALPGKGVSKTNGKGEALGTSKAFGHYLVMTWVQRPDGKKIAAKYHDTVGAFGDQLVKGSGLSLALHYRETLGKPLTK